MKKIVLLLAVFIIAACTALGIRAEDVVIVKKYTAKVDGALDEAYTKSAVFALENYDFWDYNLPKDTVTSAQGSYAYVLWDDDFLYVYAVIKDATPVSGDIRSDVDYTNWALCDNIELHLFTAGGKNKAYIHCCCNGQGLFTQLIAVEGNAPIDNRSIDKYTVVGGTTTEGYVVEIAIPKDAVAFDIADGSSFRFGFQYNDHIIDNNTENSAPSGHQNGDDAPLAKFSAEPAIEDVPTDDAPTDPVNPPDTADAGIVLSVTVMASAACIVLRKKH